MNQHLWNEILNFNLDNPPGEYGFSVRLANENYWTASFTNESILEYKKFMYLAATVDAMVSPSEIIDTIWHQHLIFTKSYQDFCNHIGKQVQHIPSTHNKEDLEKFKQAKERTKKLYEKHFGSWPAHIWENESMYDSLNLKKARLNIRTFINFGLGAALLSIVPIYFLLKPVIVTIGNPTFILMYLAIIAAVFVLLELYNRAALKKIWNEFDSTSFSTQLQPLELVYLKTGRIGDVINGTLHELVAANLIGINHDNTLQMTGKGSTKNIEELQVMNVLNTLGKPSYTKLMQQLRTKPVFWNVANVMKAFIKYFHKSRKFSRIFYTNFSILSLLFIFGLVRLITGILRDKPFTQILALNIILIVLIIHFLQRLTKQFFEQTIPFEYEHKILPGKTLHKNWQWSYFLLGSAVFLPAFIPLISSTESRSTYWSGGNNDGGGCSSSCGSSCGSCGGCGGCGD